MPHADVPWAHVGDLDFSPPGMHRWLEKEVPGWEDKDVNYAPYLVPAEEYRPLHELGVTKPKELDCQDFPATPEQVAAVRAVMGKRALRRRGYSPALPGCDGPSW
ncbi:MAG TPA: hypothetical protein VE733_17715 [Streptosporangiaceae bacterium]|jgi:hypothetical protein|nr:hypothetical protein [Streptosporangiaceae bacterium]